MIDFIYFLLQILKICLSILLIGNLDWLFFISFSSIYIGFDILIIIMSLNLKKKIIILIFDALPYEQFKNYGYKYIPNIKKTDIIKLESLIGYSAGLYPSIWTGLYPDQLNYWTTFKFDLDKSINGDNPSNSLIIKFLLEILPYFPPKFSQIISVILAQLSSRLKIFLYNYPGHFDFKLKNLFTYEDYNKFIFHPEKTKNQNQTTLFSKLRKNNITYRYIDTNQFIDNFMSYDEEIIFYFNSIMDFMGHKYGPNSRNYQNKIIEIFKWINDLISKDKYKIILFSDHGMTKGKKKFYPHKIFKKLNLKLYKDLIVWFDSTMLRIWFNSKKSLTLKKELINKFNKSNSGHFLTELEKNKYGLNFKNRYFGDIIFLVDPYFEIFPNFFNINPFKTTPGLHGYIPTHESSYGLFYSNFINYQEPMNLIDLYQILIDALKLSYFLLLKKESERDVK